MSFATETAAWAGVFSAMEIEHQIKRGNDPKERELAGTIEKERADVQYSS